MTTHDDATTWAMIHAERKVVADILGTFSSDQWAAPSWCGQWTVQMAAAHIVMGAEQTTPKFFRRMAANGFRFNTMMDHDARRLAARPADELVDRLRARLATTNGPPAPAMTMLGEIVVHGQDICQPLGIDTATDPAAVVACLDMYKNATFPLGTKKRIAGLRLNATDVSWSHGEGPEVSGPAMSLLIAITGRRGGLDALGGDGLATLRRRMKEQTTPGT